MSKKKATSDKSAKASSPPSGTQKELWQNNPDGHDYPAACDYLSLLVEPNRANAIVAKLKRASIVHRKAKDILRASRLDLLPSDNPHVAVDLAKVYRGERLSPILLVRGSLSDDVALTVADGYHRVCASYHLNENEDIPCRIVSF